MTTVLGTHPGTRLNARLTPRPRRWSRKEYLRLYEAGWFAGQRVELVAGEVIEMPSQMNPHVWGVQTGQRVLEKAFGRGYWVRAQATLNLGPSDLPDPDIAVVPGNPSPGGTYPTTALLVVEVSDTTLWFDRNRKSRTYARAGIAEYWIVNLVDRQLEVHRGPVSDPLKRPRHQYTNVTVLRPGGTITPLAAPRAKIAVARLLPPAGYA